MGQYYHAVLLGEKTNEADAEFIRAAIHSFPFNNGMKLIEHSYIDSQFMCAVEFLLCPLGMFYKTRIVWAGDYANPEPGSEKNLHHLSEGKEYLTSHSLDFCMMMKPYKFIVNHTKKQYVTKTGRVFHPLSLLTAEGNGRGGGDYHGSSEDLVGTWARDVISVEMAEPPNYTELACPFGKQ